MAKVFVTVSGTVIPRVSLNEILDVNTSGGQDGYLLTQQADGTFALEQVVTSLSGLSDVNLTGGGPLEPRDFLMYDGSEWINENVSKADVGLGNVDNTSDADKPVSTATQTALDAKADTSAVPTTLNDLSDVTITGTPTGNQALIYDGAAGVFKSLPNFSNRFEDEAEINKQSITPFAERVYTVKSDGDGIFIDPDPDTPTAGKVIVRKIYHKAGFLESGAVIGDFTLIHTFADDTAYSATTSTFEGFRDGDTYGTPPFTLIQTWEEQTAAPAFTGLLNESYGSGAAAAYSVRRLNGNYTGAAIEVERSSDNTTQDIGFDVDGNLDESALTTFCTGTVCKVRTWYDQSVTGGTGSGNDAVQTTHAKQPTIYTGGAIIKRDGRVALEFNGTSSRMTSAATVANDFTTTVVLQALTASQSNQWLLQDTSGTDMLLRQVATNFSWYDGSVYNIGTAGTERHHIFVTANASGSVVSFDGVDQSVSGIGNNGYTDLEIGGDSGSRWWHGRFQEIVIWGSYKATDRTSVEDNQGDYFTQNTPLLDTYTGAAAAYSLRKLRTAYSGSAIRVRRTSDNTEQDIGFNVFGELDTVSLASFCSGTDGFVKVFYDQSGNANDATQTATGSQPKIYDSVTGVVTENGKPAVEFDGSSDTFATTYQPQLGTASTADLFTFAVSSQASSHTGTIWRASDGNSRVVFNRWQASSFQSLYRDNNNINVNAASSALSLNQQYLLAGTLVNGTVTNYVDGTTSGTSSGSFTGNIDLAAPFYIGSSGGSTERLNGNLQELVFYSSDQSTNRTNIESNIATFYGITL
jgi:hypothetical protein